jgi:hypothetical protein
MTEAEWLGCTDPKPMLDLLRRMKENRSKGGRRRLRLFGCACCRRVAPFLTKRGQRWLELAETYADGVGNREEYRNAAGEDIGPVDGQRVAHLADLAAWFTLGSNVMIAAAAAASSAADVIGMDAWHRHRSEEMSRAHELEEQTSQAHILREIFGNPFRPTTSAPAWLAWNGGTVPKLAQNSYAERAFDRLPVLADALEEAGCTDADILSHLRGPGPHVRGCWALDLLLGKA